MHVVTVNDYLAKRDSEWMGKLYRWLGLSVGLIAQGMDGDARRAAYAADITYGTNNEFGFDYLRDNMKFYAEQLVQRGHHYAIVDEVDSILIDEARTPLIISGASDESTDLYQKVDEVVRTLEKEKHYTVDEKPRRSPTKACCTWKNSSASRTSTTPPTSPRSIMCCSPSRRTPYSAATSTTS